MLPLQDWLELWRAKAEDFLSGGDKPEIYYRCVRAALADPETERLLGKRDGVTWDAVFERMRLSRYHRYATIRCPSPALDEAVEKLDEIFEKHERAAGETAWNWRVVCSLIVIGATAVLIFGGLLALLVAVLTAGGVMFTLSWRGSAAWSNLRQCLVAAALGISWLVQRFEVGACAARWGEQLQERGTGPIVADLVRHMLGDDPDSLFIPEDYDWGLRAPRAPGYVVENGARRQLERKLSHIEDGTIAVCGPRGAGKTTLLEQSVKKAGFGVIVQAPATYTPHDFLLSLSVQLCERYMRDQDYDPPELARLSPARKVLRRLKTQAKRLGRWSSFAVPAAALLVLGLSASVRTLYTQYATSVADFARTHAESIRDEATEIWQGHAVVASVTVTVAGLAWWQSRHAAWLPRLLGRLWLRGSRALGLLLAWLSAGTVLLDQQMRQQVLHFQRTQPAELGKTGLYAWILMVVWVLLRRARDSGAEFPLGRWHISLEKIFRPLVAAAGMYLLLYLVDNPQTHTLLSDPENPLRLAGIITGVLLSKAGDWSPRPEEPELITQCRSHLYRLQTIQQATHGLTTGAPQILSLGTNHATSVSTVPPNYPELVEEFRNLLRCIASGKAKQGKTVVIAIDELDRLGTDTQALAFLSEIKAILGVPDVYYLISVAEDVGAAFVRRGLPHRDVTDSSLDDIIHVQPSTLEESRAILAKRSQALKDPYVMLAHALSGGILRDLLRYGLQIREIQDKTQSHELTDISRHLVLEELAETFAGFRTLLSKQQWTSNTSDVLGSFRTLCGYLRDPCPCTEAEMLHTLEQFAFYSHATRPDRAAGDNSTALQELTSDARQLIDEASAYAYFSLTLLDIFSIEGFERRTQLAAAHGPDGDPERLADARQELGISPYSARPLIDTIRKAWSLPLAPTTTGRIPPSLVSCPRHNPIE
jgi:Cdc6-like AAA superfamily ATPase